MDYFISIENISYYQWQTSLLIESFKEVNLQNNLVVCLYPSKKNSPIIRKSFVKNISNHKRTCYFKNFTDKSNILNKFYSLLYCLKNNIIKQPFLMLLEPDLVIRKPITVPSGDTPTIMYDIDKDFTFEKIKNKYLNFWDVLKIKKEDCEKNWLNLGEAIFFNNIPEYFFERLIYTAENLFQKQTKEILRIALLLTIIEIYTKTRFHGNDFVIPAMSIGDSNFLTYKNGIYPDFYKSMFFAPPLGIMSFGDPFETLTKMYNCPNSKYIADLAKKMLD